MTPRRCDGVGTCVKELLASIGIVTQDGCRCDDLAAKWNQLGVDWCQGHIDEMADALVQNTKDLRHPTGLAANVVSRLVNFPGGTWSAKLAAKYIIARAIERVQ